MAIEDELARASEAAGPPSRRWLWFGIIAATVAVLLIGVFVGLNIYRSQQALTTEKLAAARQRWQAAGINSYDISVDTSGNTRGTYRLKVRNGKIVQAGMNEVVIVPETPQNYYWTVPGLFDILQRDIDWDTDPNNPTSHTEVYFDPNDGHLVRYLRIAPGQRIVIEVRLEPM